MTIIMILIIVMILITIILILILIMLFIVIVKSYKVHASIGSILPFSNENKIMFATNCP